MRNLIIEYEDFRNEMAEVLNKHIQTLPAVFISEYLEKLTVNFKSLSQKQLSEAITKESEVRNNERSN